MLCCAPLITVASHVAGLTEVAQLAVLNLLHFTIPEYEGICYSIRLIMGHDGSSPDVGKFFQEKLLGTLQKQSSSFVA